MPNITAIKINGVTYEIEGSGSGAVTGVKGNAESTYRTGNVNLTPANIGAITNTVNNLTNYYLKTETYTKTEVDNLISSISTLSFEVVQTLPTTNIKTNVIYLVPKSTAQTNNTYDEYINTTGTTAGWEKIGDTEIDLSNYYTKSETDTLLNGKVDKSGAVTGVKGDSESTYRTGNVNITKANIGLGDVGNFKAVSTVASQGLTDTEKSNARENIGAGTSNFSGSYNDLSHKPTIPTKTSDITNDSGYYSSSDDTETTISYSDKFPFYDDSDGSRKNSTWTNIINSILNIIRPSFLSSTNPSGTGRLSISRKQGSTEGTDSIAIGTDCVASDTNSVAIGYKANATKTKAVSIGDQTTASEYAAFATGNETTASGQSSFSCNIQNTASGNGSFSSGGYTVASGVASSTFGRGTIAASAAQQARGKYNISDSNGTYAEIVGGGTADDARANIETLDWSGNLWVAGSVIDGSNNTLSNKVDKVSGKGLSTNDYTTAEKNKLSGIASGAEVNQNAISGIKINSSTIQSTSKSDTIELIAGNNVTLTPDLSNKTITIASTGGGSGSVSWGAIGGTLSNQTDLQNALNAKVNATNPTGTGSLSINRKSNTTVGTKSTTIGNNNTASGNYSYAEGDTNISSGESSHSEGYITEAIGYTAHAEGAGSIARGDYSHAENSSTANGEYAHAEGRGTIASSNYQHTQGKFNIEDVQGIYADITGWGSDNLNRANIETLKTNGDFWVAGSITDGSGNVLSNKVDKVTGKGLSSNDYTTTEKNKLSGIASGAEVNQNAFSNVKIGSTTVAADSKTDTLELVAGANVTLTPDATNDKVTISATDTTYSNATQSSSGLMSATDKTKLDGLKKSPEILWTNSSPDDTFVAQTITVNANINNYRFYEIIFKSRGNFSSSDQKCKSTGLVSINAGTCLQRNYQYSETRDVSTPTYNSSTGKTSFAFAACVRYTSYGSSTTSNQNGICVPYQIVGHY